MCRQYMWAAIDGQLSTTCDSKVCPQAGETVAINDSIDVPNHFVCNSNLNFFKLF